jgi:hypothetical protein
MKVCQARLNAPLELTHQRVVLRASHA